MIITRDQHLLQYIQPRDNRYFAARQPWVALVEQDIIPMARQGIPIVLPAGLEALPQALITPAEDSHPFGEHTPRLWQHYPFTLTEHIVGLDADDSGKLGTVLQGDPNAPHWLDRTGYRLFDDHGQASDFLNKTLTGPAGHSAGGDADTAADLAIAWASGTDTLQDPPCGATDGGLPHRHGPPNRARGGFHRGAGSALARQSHGDRALSGGH